MHLVNVISAKNEFKNEAAALWQLKILKGTEEMRSTSMRLSL